MADECADSIGIVGQITAVAVVPTDERAGMTMAIPIWTGCVLSKVVVQQTGVGG